MIGLVAAGLAALALAGVAGSSRIAHAEEPHICKPLLDQGWVETPGGWAYAGWELGTAFRLNVDQIDAFERLLRGFSDNGMTLVVALLPVRPMADPAFSGAPAGGYDRAGPVRQYEATLQWLAGQGVVPVGLLDTATRLHDGPTEPFFFRQDDHWTPTGARAAARLVHEALAAVPAYVALPRTRYVTTDIGEVQTLTAVARKCGAAFAPVPTHHFSTRPAQPRDTSLLDEVPTAPVTLLGSSYSAPEYNFAGYLEEELGQDVLAVSVPGGRAVSAMMTWLSSPEYLAGRPKVVVWELAMAHLFWGVRPDAPSVLDPQFYRQLVPALYGDCAADALLTNTLQLDGQTGQLVANPRGLPIVGPDYYLSLVFDDPAIQAFTVHSEHADGADDYAFKPSGRVSSTGRFFLEVDPVDETPLVRASVTLPVASHATVRVQVCHK